MSEHRLMNEIRAALSNGDVRLFRQNSGEGWVGDAVKLKNGDVLIRNPRRFIAGFPGLADLGGWRSVDVTPDMVGQRIAVYVALEVKTKRGAVKPAQTAFLRAVKESGGVAAIVRSVADADAALVGVDK